MTKYKVDNPSRLKSWEPAARQEILRWLNDDAYRNDINSTTMINEFLGPFTKFMYHFSDLCECRWGVMTDFCERRQRVYLTNRYYAWMHRLRDEIIESENNKKQ